VKIAHEDDGLNGKRVGRVRFLQMLDGQTQVCINPFRGSEGFPDEIFLDRPAEDRIAQVSGKAGAEPLYPDNRIASANRRITIVLMREAPVLPPGFDR